jgi:glutamate-ammonia-ligase adenylyltransferase
MAARSAAMRDETTPNAAATPRLDRLWGDWTERLRTAGIAPPDDELPAQLRRVWDGSDFVAQACLTDPEILQRLSDGGLLNRPLAPGELAARLSEALAGVTDDHDLGSRLRVFRREQMVRIIWRDLTGQAPLAETLEDLSELADQAILQALELLHGWAVERWGEPRDGDGRAQRLIVLGMGKLGARELNLSSDIDLIFAYANRGETDGTKSLDNETFFTRVARNLIKVLGEQTADGFVFRVDVRLRPFGDAGPLVLHFDALETYYQSQGRPWERYAMIKARPITGDPADVAELESILRPFVFRRYIDFGAIEAIRELKTKISAELHKRGMDANIKLGRGGIREIEFIGQAFQLIRGGREPELQVRPILQVLAHLEAMGELRSQDATELSEAYRLLRRTENHIQAWRDEQTHKVPADQEGRDRLARSLGYTDWSCFEPVLQAHRDRVQHHFEQVFAERDELDEVDQPLATAWASLSGEHVALVLQDAGFPDAADASAALAGFRDSPACRRLSDTARRRLDQLMPLLLRAVAMEPDATAVLKRLLDLLEAVMRRTAYLNLLVENPPILGHLVRLVAESPWVGEQLARQPVLFDELLDPRRLYSPLHRRELEEELDTLLARVEADDLEQQMERLRQFAQGNRLRVAAADLTEAIPLMVVSDYLTEIAEVVLQRVYRMAWEHMIERYGRPQEIEGEESGFAVIGYGKLGGIELGYGSDLDLVFLHGSRDVNAMTDGKRSVSNDQFYARLAQRMIHLLNTRTPSGQLYEVDTRLRPNGQSGLLVSSLNAFEKYQQGDAWTWEHQALIRARAVTGDPEVAGRFDAIRRTVLGRQRDPQQLRDEVRQMRERMRTELDRSNAEHFDPKQGVGGVADIEFMVQYAILRWSHEHPALLAWTDNVRLLDSLATEGLLAREQADLLADTYRTLRAATHRAALRGEDGLLAGEEFTAARAAVSAIWHDLMES